MRGNLNRATRPRCRHRSIPAYAGEPDDEGEAARVLPVYPRVCGGTTGGPPYDGPKTGLSPRMRGNLFFVRRNGQSERSIPAYAGEPEHSVILGG